MSKHPWRCPALSAAFVLLTLGSPSFAADNISATAAQVDQLLRTEVPFATANKQPPKRIDDERFLRRASLDIIGRIPTPEEVTAFVLDPASDKRPKIVAKLLANPRYGENWGRYWRDVIMYRKTEERQQFLVGLPLAPYLTESFNSNKPWSQIATEFVTATGGANSNGACGLIVAQQGQPEETAAEVSRIFLGVQLQCAQCHDHPTDRWKREQFHELAAFFPRVASQPSRIGQGSMTLPEITLTVTDSPPRFGMRGPMAMRRFGTPEHHMSDPKNPQSDGTLMQPVFFATGDQVPVGTKDADRRGSLSKWMTDQSNPYFAKAFVNRLWSELTGEGFYEPVDDMGPDRQGTATKTLDYLAGQFANSNYDVKRLFRVIIATDMYQLPSSPRRGPEDPPMQHNVAQRLRADQLFNNLLVALDASEPMQSGFANVGQFRRRVPTPREKFASVFGYDPSSPRDELTNSIPQALMMMHDPIISDALHETRNTLIGRKLAAIKDDRQLVQELYLRTVGREPMPNELLTALHFVAQVRDRPQAFEDILWSLLNSAEFLYRK